MEIFTGLTAPILLILRICVLLFLLIYILFATVVVRQVRIMTETLQVGMERSIKIITFIHLLVAIVIFVLSIFTL